MTILQDPPGAPPAPETSVRREPAQASTPPRRGWTSWQLDVSRTFIVVGLLVAWVFAYLMLFSGLQTGHAQRELYDQFRTELALGTAPVGAPIEPGTPVALLSVPRAGIKNLIVVEGSGSAQLQKGAGHQRGSVLPGQSGVSVVLGRSLSFGAPFGKLRKLRIGDEITVTTGQGTFNYALVRARYKGDTVPALPAGGTASRLTLVTSVGHGLLARLTPSDTAYFDAELTKGVGPGPVSTSVATDQPMTTHVSGGTLAQLALALQLLLAALFAATWARARWSGPAAWITGVPTVLAALWLVSGLATRLLPNLV